MDPTTILIGLALVFGFYMAWNIGANDVANAMGTSVGSGALTLKRAIIVAAVFEFAGAYFLGAHVSTTIRSGIFDPALITDPNIMVMGMIASLLAAGVWLQLASYFGWPVSTSHSIVGAVVGFGCVAVGPGAIHWFTDDGENFGGVAKIAMSWVISPLLAGAVAYILFNFIRKSIFYQPDPVRATKRITPFMVFFVIVVLTGVTSMKALKHVWGNIIIDGKPLKADDPIAMLITLAVAIVLGLIAAGIAAMLVRRIDDEPVENQQRYAAVYVTRSLDKARKHLRRVQQTSHGEIQSEASNLLARVAELEALAEQHGDPEVTQSVYQKVERIFVYLQVLSACFVAFAHGANDVANAIGPLSAAVQTLRNGAIVAKSAVPDWALLLGGVGIVLGLATWGWRVMETVGRRITELTPTRGFTAELAAAVTILLASLPWLAVPISTTHTLVGAVLGVGMARGIGAINLNVVRDIVASWIITIPAGAGLAIFFYYILSAIFG